MAHCGACRRARLSGMTAAQQAGTTIWWVPLMSAFTGALLAIAGGYWARRLEDRRARRAAMLVEQLPALLQDVRSGLGVMRTTGNTPQLAAEVRRLVDSFTALEHSAIAIATADHHQAVRSRRELDVLIQVLTRHLRPDAGPSDVEYLAVEYGPQIEMGVEQYRSWIASRLLTPGRRVLGLTRRTKARWRTRLREP